jgi:hypothetical protein
MANRIPGVPSCVRAPAGAISWRQSHNHTFLIEWAERAAEFLQGWISLEDCYY